MSKPCSKDLRALVVAEILSGSSISAAARRSHVSVSTAVRWWNRWLQKGNADALKMGAERRSHKSEPRIGRIVGWIEKQPCLSL